MPARARMKRTADSSPKNKRPTSQKKFNKQDNFGIHKPLTRIKPELKYKDNNPTPSLPPFGTWITPVLINGMAIGGGATQRVGRRVTFTKLISRVSFYAATAIPPTEDTKIRILVFLDKQSNGATPTITQVLATDNFTSPMNLDNRDRFVVLADVITKDSVGINNQATELYFTRKFNIETTFNVNNNGDVGDIATGSIFFSICGSNVLFSTGISSNNYHRLRFVDF